MLKYSPPPVITATVMPSPYQRPAPPTCSDKSLAPPTTKGADRQENGRFPQIYQ